MFANLKRVPNGKAMFSDNPHYPAASLSFDFKNELPAHQPMGYRPPEARADAPPPDLAAAVTGQQRYKYFKRPIVPFMHAVPPTVMMDTGRGDAGAAATGGAGGDSAAADPASSVGAGEDSFVNADGKRTVAVQSVYRESEAQTDPYTPDFVVAEGDEPAVLGLQALTFGKGLPAGKAEVELIERQRQKKAFEAALPPITDEASFELRRRMMEEQELLEWGQREAEIDRIQNDRLALLQRAIDARDRENEFIQDQRVEEMRRTLTDEKDRRVAAVQQRRITMLRKLTKERAHDALAPRKRDVIEEYANPASGVYAPVTRLGRHPDRDKHADYEAATADLTSMGSLMHLEATLPRSATATSARRPREGAPRSTAERMDRTIADGLEKMATLLATNKAEAAAAAAEEAEQAELRRRRVARPRTPDVPEEDADAGDADIACLLLQKLLRGRAVQNMMYEGKERRLELIRELREVERQEEEKEALAAADARAAADEHLEAAQNALMDAAQGEVASATVDFMAKELTRMRTKARVEGVAVGAALERRTREAEESGRRQAEEAVRARQDAVFRQLRRVHEQSAVSYVDSLLAEATERVAATDAASEALLKKGLIAPAVDAAEAEINGDGGVVRDLVASFLLPEVERQQLEAQVALEERRFTDAAAKSIGDAMADAESRSRGSSKK